MYCDVYQVKWIIEKDDLTLSIGCLLNGGRSEWKLAINALHISVSAEDQVLTFWLKITMHVYIEKKKRKKNQHSGMQKHILCGSNFSFGPSQWLFSRQEHLYCLFIHWSIQFLDHSLSLSLIYISHPVLSLSLPPTTLHILWQRQAEIQKE